MRLHLHHVQPPLCHIAVVLNSLSNLCLAILADLDGNDQVQSCICLHSQATNGIDDGLVVLLCLIHVKPSKLTEGAAAVRVGSGGDSRPPDGGVVKEVADSVVGLLRILLYLSAGLPAAVKDGSRMNSSMPVITWLKMPHFLN